MAFALVAAAADIVVVAAEGDAFVVADAFVVVEDVAAAAGRRL